MKASEYVCREGLAWGASWGLRSKATMPYNKLRQLRWLSMVVTLASRL